MVAPIRYLSRRIQEQKIGILQNTEEEKVLEVVGRVGIGTTIFDAEYNLDVRGTANVSGILSVGQIISGAGNTFSDLTVTGVSTFQSAALFADGTEAEPSISFINDTDLGLYRPADNEIAFTNGGSESVRITSDGKVGIGTTQPLDLFSKLSVFSTDVVTETRIESTDAAGYASIVLKSDDIEGAFYASSAEDVIVLRNNSNTTGTALGLAGTRSGGADIAIFRETRNVLIGNNPLVSSQTGTANQKLQVQSGAYISGSVGIGTTLPSQKLDVNGNVNIRGELHGPELFIIDPAAVGDNTGAVRIKGDLYVDGTEFIVDSENILLADYRVGIATTVATNLLLDGAGISIGATNIEKTFTYNNTANTLESSIGLGVTEGGEFKTGTDSVLNRTTLGPTVVNSSLTNLGTLTELNVSGVSTFVGDVSIADKIVHTGDTDTAIRFPANDTFTVETAGTERLRVTSAGDVGIGTDNPAANLDVWAGAANTTYFRGGTGNPARQLQIRSEGTVTPGAAHIFNAPSVSGTLIFETNSTEVIRINSSQNVGINTNNPSETLDVNGDVRFRDKIFDSTGDAGVANYVLASGGPGSPWSWKIVTDVGAGNLDAIFVRQDGSDVGAAGTNTTLDFYENFSLIQPSAGIASIRLAENINITGINTVSGNLGIGTDTSDARLTVDVGTAVTAFEVNGSEGQLFSVTNNLTSGSIFSVNDAFGVPSIDVDADGTIQLAPFGATEYVGVGLTNPTSKLHVFGDQKVTGITSEYARIDFNTEGNSTSTIIGFSSYYAASNYRESLALFAPEKVIARPNLTTGGAFEIWAGGSSSIGYRPFKLYTESHASLATMIIGHYDQSVQSAARSGKIIAPSGNGTDIGGGTLILSGGESTGSGAGGPIIFRTSSAGTSGVTTNTAEERVRIDSSGNVGINTTQPTAKLEAIQTEQREDGLRVYNATFDAGATGQSGEVQLIGDYDGTGMDLISAKLGGVTKFVVDGDDGGVGVGTDIPKGLFEIFDPNYDRGSTGGNASVSFIRISDDNFLEYLVDWRIDDAPIFRIKPTGNVGEANTGIGTGSNLTAKLTVGNIENTGVTNKGATAFKTLNSSGGVGESAIYLEEQSGSEGWYLKVNSSGDLQFNDSGVSDRITFQDGGNVGIGTDNPTSKLHVIGDLSINQTTVVGSATSSLTTVASTPIYTGLSTTIYRSVEYTIQATEGTNFHSTKILALHDGTTAYHSEYGTIFNNSSVATFDVDVSGGNLRLLATGASASQTDYVINFVATKV